MSLPRRASTGMYDKVYINVFDIHTKEIVFSGDNMDVANFLSVNVYALTKYLSKKYRFRNKYALRIKSENKKETV